MFENQNSFFFFSIKINIIETNSNNQNIIEMNNA